MRTLNKYFKDDESFFDKVKNGCTDIKIIDITSDFISDTYYSIYRIYRSICRFFFWGWKLRNSYDWDFSYIYGIINVKLQRMENEFINNGHCVWNNDINNKGFKKLREAKVLAYRLCNTDPSDYDWMDELDKKYKINRLDIFDFNVQKPENYRKEFRFWSKKQDEKKANEKKRFFYLLEKYGDSWWD